MTFESFYFSFHIRVSNFILSQVQLFAAAEKLWPLVFLKTAIVAVFQKNRVTAHLSWVKSKFGLIKTFE